MTSGHWQLVNGIVTARDNWKLTISNTIDNHEHRQNGMCPTSRFLLHTSQISVRNNWHHSQVTQHTSGCSPLTGQLKHSKIQIVRMRTHSPPHHHKRPLTSLTLTCVCPSARSPLCVCLSFPGRFYLRVLEQSLVPPRIPSHECHTDMSTLCASMRHCLISTCD